MSAIFSKWNESDRLMVTVTDTRMEPRYKPGEIIEIAPAMAAGPGDFVRIVGRAESWYKIAQLVETGRDFYVFRQFNPPRVFEVRKANINHIWRIVATWTK